MSLRITRFPEYVKNFRYLSRLLVGTPHSEFRLCDSKWNKRRPPSPVLLSVVFAHSVLRVVISYVHHRSRCVFSRGCSSDLEAFRMSMKGFYVCCYA